MSYKCFYEVESILWLNRFRLKLEALWSNILGALTAGEAMYVKICARSGCLTKLLEFLNDKKHTLDLGET